MTHTSEPPASAVLWQRLGRSPYAHAANVAMQLQGNPEIKISHCAPYHRGTLKLEIFRFLLRYPSSLLSKRRLKLGLQTHVFHPSNRLTQVNPFFYLPAGTRA